MSEFHGDRFPMTHRPGSRLNAYQMDFNGLIHLRFESETYSCFLNIGGKEKGSTLVH